MQVHDAVLHLDEDEDRRLALGDPLEQVGVIGEAFRKFGQLLRELQQQLKPLALLEREEVVPDLREALGKRAVRRFLARQGPLRAQRP